MDYNKIGEFISKERKLKKLTQVKLAEKVFVSDKTISKWEKGNGIPDTNTLTKLCEVFNCTINELLNGERISKQDYSNKAEEKLLELQKIKEEKDKLLLFVEIIASFCVLLPAFTMVFLSTFLFEKGFVTIPIIMIIVGIVSILAICLIAIRIEQKAGYYYCEKCGHKHIPKFNQVLFATHINRTRKMKCPKCKQKSWQRKIIK